MAKYVDDNGVELDAPFGGGHILERLGWTRVGGEAPSEEVVPSQEGAGDGDPGESPVGDDYEDWSKPELVEELKNRGLPHTGKVAELVERLREDDSADDEDDADA